jgi:hypothetical protein
LTPIAVKQIKARRVSASSHPVIRDAAKAYSLQTFAPTLAQAGNETKGLADVPMGSEKAHRQLTNFTGNCRIPQVFGCVLWITKLFIISGLPVEAKDPSRARSFCCSRNLIGLPG